MLRMGGAPHNFNMSFENPPAPISVVDDTIKVKEHLLDEDKPYPFQYQGKD